MATIKEADSKMQWRLHRKLSAPSVRKGCAWKSWNRQPKTASGFGTSLNWLSPDVPDERLNTGFAAILSHKKREYKTLTVLEDTGEVTSMKIRELSDA